MSLRITITEAEMDALPADQRFLLEQLAAKLFQFRINREDVIELDGVLFFCHLQDET